MNINTNINALVAGNAYAAAAYRNFNASSKCARSENLSTFKRKKCKERKARKDR